MTENAKATKTTQEIRNELIDRVEEIRKEQVRISEILNEMYNQEQGFSKFSSFEILAHLETEILEFPGNRIFVLKTDDGYKHITIIKDGGTQIFIRNFNTTRDLDKTQFAKPLKDEHMIQFIKMLFTV